MAKVVSNICGSINKHDINKIGLSESINMFQESVNPNENYVSILQRSIPGMKTVLEIDGHCRGQIVSSNGTIYTVFDNKVYAILNKVAYNIGIITYSNENVSMCEANEHIVIADGINVYCVKFTLNIAQQTDYFRTIKLPYSIEGTTYMKPASVAFLYSMLVVSDKNTDVMFVSMYRPFIQLDEYGNVDFNIFEVDENNYTSRYFRANYQPDNVDIICSNSSRLYALGKTSYQVFQYTGDQYSPFSSPDTASKMIGIADPASLASVGDYTFFLGDGSIGHNGIYMLTNGSIDAQRISNVFIEQELQKKTNKVVMNACAWSSGCNHLFYCLSFDDISYVYDVNENSWHKRSSKGSYWRYTHPILTDDGMYFATDNAIVKEDYEHFVEHDGTPMIRKRIGGVIYSNYNNFFIDSLTIMMNNGQVAMNDECRLQMRYTFDGNDWTDYEMINVGSAGDYDYDCTFYSFGMGKIFTIELSTTDDFEFSLMGLKIVSSECSW